MSTLPKQKVITNTDLEAIVTKQVQDTMAQSSQSLLGDLDRLITDKLSGQVTEMRRLRDAVDTKPHKFRKRGNEEQFNINSKVLEKITDAETALGCLLDKENLQIDEREVTELHAAHAAVVESKDLLKKRQKLVKLADKSESGWKVVDEYESNELAEDSEDEKKINKAENRASRKIKENRRFGTRGFFGRRQGRWHPYQPQGYTPSYGRFNHTATGGMARTETSTSGITQSGRGGPYRPGVCFACGRTGHWRSECRLVKGSDGQGANMDQNTKLSIITTCNSDKSREIRPEGKTLDVSSIGILRANKILSSKVSPVGRLRDNIQSWENIGSNKSVLEIIKDGYKIPFLNSPKSMESSNNKSARDNHKFVVKEIQNLLQKGCITELSEKPDIINPLTVAFGKSGKPRLVLDAKNINPYIYKTKFCMEDVSVARNICLSLTENI